MVRHLTRDQFDYDTAPDTDDRDLPGMIDAAVAEILAAAPAWLGWDGRPVYRDGNAWTPHKALRRIADHLLDHLTEIECRFAGLPSPPDRWHGRMVTTDADFARFTEIDLDEATSRLTRLAACYRARLSGVDPARLESAGPEGAWTLRQVVHHVAGVTAYVRMLDPAPLGVPGSRGDSARTADQPSGPTGP